MLIKGESREEWNRLVADLTARFQPADNVELGLIQDMASATWRARRAERMEAELISADLDDIAHLDGPAATSAEQTRRTALAYAKALGFNNAIAEFCRHSERLNRLWIRLHAKLKELQKDRLAAAPPPANEPEKPARRPASQKSKNEPGRAQSAAPQPDQQGFYIHELLEKLRREASCDR